ncbi:MAG: 30S ribosomal protein S6 [Chloroflexota bacterium]|nr:30S ribosomal protein S6 [Chloroflexota bacterium]
MHNYELVFITYPDLEEEELEEIKGKIGDLITSGGGQVTEVDLWGRRRLAFPIADQLEGQYVLMRFELDPPHLPELERTMSLESRIIRRLLVRN